MSENEIKSFDYLKSLSEIEEEITVAFKRVLHSGRLISGPETDNFEAEFAEITGAKHCIGVSSGTAAIYLSLMALGVGSGDEVITVSNTCAPTVAAIRQTGAIPVFVDVRADDLMMDIDAVRQKVGKKTRCLLPVHLWGRAVDMSGLGNLAKELGIPIVEDCAQAHGTLLKGRQVGTFGAMGCFSFYPTKNIGAFGDAGAIITNDEVLAGELRKLRVYGYDASGISLREGTNARISELQAAFLRVKIQVFEDWLARRRRVAEVYNSHIISSEIELPPSQKSVEPSYHQYVIRAKNRRKVMDGLKGAKISSAIHYPVPVHLMPAYRFLGGEKLDLPVTLKAASEIISLPIHEAITENEALVIARALNTIGG